MYKVYTHSQQFHVDELMAIALLDTYVFKGQQYEVIRTRDAAQIAAAKNDDKTFVIDVGKEYNPEKLNFDHHQNDANLFWDNGVPYSSCGLVWKWLRENKYLDQKMNAPTMNRIEKELILKIDKHDNGVSDWHEGIIFILYNRKANDPKEQDIQFKRALRSVKDYYLNFFAYVRGHMQSEKEITKAIEKSEHYKHIVICDSNIKDVATKVSELCGKEMVIYPRTSNSWIIRSTPKSHNEKFTMKAPAPEEWRGLSDKELEEASGISGMIFCHKSGYMTMLQGTLDEAIKVANLIVCNQIKK